MTEKIIIDGVDVAGCENCYKEYDNWDAKDYIRCNDTCNGMCEGHNCYYKQLKRLEQENARLKEKYDTLTNKFLNSETDKTRLEQENANLRDENLNASNKILFNGLRVDAARAKMAAKKYKQALKEIKEVATLDDVNCTISPETMNVSKNVLKIVNEVLND